MLQGLNLWLKYRLFDKKIPMWYQRVTIRLIYGYHMFKNIFYQIDDVAMGLSPCSPALANLFMYSFENNWFKVCLL